MEPQNIGDLIDQMIRLAVKNPNVLDEGYNGEDAARYQTIRSQLVDYFRPKKMESSLEDNDILRKFNRLYEQKFSERLTQASKELYGSEFKK